MDERADGLAKIRELSGRLSNWLAGKPVDDVDRVLKDLNLVTESTLNKNPSSAQSREIVAAARDASRVAGRLRDTHGCMTPRATRGPTGRVTASMACWECTRQWVRARSNLSVALVRQGLDNDTGDEALQAATDAVDGGHALVQLAPSQAGSQTAQGTLASDWLGVAQSSLAKSLIMKAKVFAHLNELDAALKAAAAAVSEYDSLRDRGSKYFTRRGLVTALIRQAKILESKGSPDAALEALDQAVEEQRQIRNSDLKLARLLERRARMLTRVGRAEAASRDQDEAARMRS